MINITQTLQEKDMFIAKNIKLKIFFKLIKRKILK